MFLSFDILSKNLFGSFNYVSSLLTFYVRTFCRTHSNESFCVGGTLYLMIFFLKAHSFPVRQLEQEQHYEQLGLLMIKEQILLLLEKWENGGRRISKGVLRLSWLSGNRKLVEFVVLVGTKLTALPYDVLKYKSPANAVFIMIKLSERQKLCY